LGLNAEVPLLPVWWLRKSNAALDDEEVARCKESMVGLVNPKTICLPRRIILQIGTLDTSKVGLAQHRQCDTGVWSTFGATTTPAAAAAACCESVVVVVGHLPLLYVRQFGMALVPGSASVGMRLLVLVGVKSVGRLKNGTSPVDKYK
jgi:hypothetical protein